MRASASKPNACQKRMGGKPKIAGISPFQSSFTHSPPKATNAAKATITTGAKSSHRILMVGSSFRLRCVIGALQSLAQMEHRVALAREERVHADAGLGGQSLEAASVQLVRDEDLALFDRQLVDRRYELVEE